MRYRKRTDLGKLLESTFNTQILITSKKGSYVKDKEAQILACLKSFRNFLIVFGTPKKGVDEMLALEGLSIDAYEYVTQYVSFSGDKDN